ncbi:MAG: S9 family peptidase, partial [Candidatus Eremiobacterota bacterium]
AAGGSPGPGASVAFLTNITGVNQVWRVQSPGSWPVQLTFEPDRVASVTCSPDGKWLCFERDQGGDEHNQLYLIPPQGGVPRALTANPKAIHSFGGFSPDSGRIAFTSTERNGTDFDGYVLDLATGKRERIYARGGYCSVACWSPDGIRLILSRANSNVDGDLFLVNLADRSVRHLTPHQGAANFQFVQWPAPGTHLFLATDLGREFVTLARMEVEKGVESLEFLEPDRHDVDALAVSDDGTRLAMARNMDGYSALLTGTPQKFEPVEHPQGVMDGFAFSPDGKRLTLTFVSPVEPPNVYVLQDDRLQRVTESTLAGVDPASFVSPTLVRYPTFDGKQIPAFLFLPARRTGKVPAIVSVHGGPEAQTRASFSGLSQYFLSRGYAVMAPNVRGSTGYGRTFTHLDDVRLRMDSVKDLEYANRYLAEGGVVAPDRIAVMGGSYGGYMTLAAVTFQPQRWAAGVDIVGISNFISFLNNTGAYRRALRIAEYGDPVKDEAFLREVSPFFHVDEIQAPMLIIQGANDPRVPQSESDQMVASLKKKGLPVEYLLYQDEGHGLAKLSNRVDAYTRAVAFLDRHLKR